MITAELYFVTFIAEHNLPFLASDHFTKLCKVMFPDGDIAKRYSSGRTKSTTLVKHTLAPTLSDQVVRGKLLRSPSYIIFLPLLVATVMYVIIVILKTFFDIFMGKSSNICST